MTIEQNFESEELLDRDELLEFREEIRILEESVKDGIKKPQNTSTEINPTENEDAIEDQQDTVEYISEKPRFILDHVFDDASKVKSTALYNIAHNDKKRPECKNFLRLVIEERYDEAKWILIDMLPKMDIYINKYQWADKVNFNSISETLKSITDPIELWQTVLWISQLFSRTPSVVWKWKRKYGFIKWRKWGLESESREIGDVLKQRNKEIISNFEKSNLPESLKTAYINLVSASENAMELDSKWYQDKEKKTKQAHNKIWINLWNWNNLENPLLDPEIYKGMQIKFGDLEFEGKSEIVNRTMENIVNEKSLLLSVLKQNNIDLSWMNLKVKILSNENWKIKFVINGVEVTLWCDMKLWYYSQCVNPIILTDNFLVKVGKIHEEWDRKMEGEEKIEDKKDGIQNNDSWLEDARKYGYLPEELGGWEDTIWWDKKPWEEIGWGEYEVPPQDWDHLRIPIPWREIDIPWPKPGNPIIIPRPDRDPIIVPYPGDGKPIEIILPGMEPIIIPIRWWDIIIIPIPVKVIIIPLPWWEVIRVPWPKPGNPVIIPRPDRDPIIVPYPGDGNPIYIQLPGRVIVVPYPIWLEPEKPEISDIAPEPEEDTIPEIITDKPEHLKEIKPIMPRKRSLPRRKRKATQPKHNSIYSLGPSETTQTARPDYKSKK